MVRLRVFLRLLSISQTAMRETGSRPVVGSSRKKMRGSCTRPRAISRRRRIPPERVFGLSAAPLGEVDRLKHVRDVFFALGTRNAVKLGVDAEILFDRKVLVAGQRLGNDADHAANCVGVFADVVAGNDRFSAGDRNECGHHADQRALPCTVGAEQTEDFAIGHGEADAFDGLEIAVTLDDVFNRDGRAAPEPERLSSLFWYELAVRHGLSITASPACFWG